MNHLKIGSRNRVSHLTHFEREYKSTCLESQVSIFKAIVAGFRGKVVIAHALRNKRALWEAMIMISRVVCSYRTSQALNDTILYMVFVFSHVTVDGSEIPNNHLGFF